MVAGLMCDFLFAEEFQAKEEEEIKKEEESGATTTEEAKAWLYSHEMINGSCFCVMLLYEDDLRPSPFLTCLAEVFIFDHLYWVKNV